MKKIIITESQVRKLIDNLTKKKNGNRNISIYGILNKIMPSNPIPKS
jgi:hypothetical protein